MRSDEDNKLIMMLESELSSERIKSTQLAAKLKKTEEDAFKAFDKLNTEIRFLKKQLNNPTPKSDPSVN